MWWISCLKCYSKIKQKKRKMFNLKKCPKMINSSGKKESLKVKKILKAKNCLGNPSQI